MVFFSYGFLFTQNIGINTSGAPGNAGAALDIQFEDKGLLIPRVNIADLTTYAPIGGTPTESMLVYNTNTTTGEGFHYWDGANWVRLMVGSSSAAPADAWETTGNAGTNPSSNFLGTTDAQDLVFRTDNTEQMRLTTDGWLGIGTNTPDAFLDIDDEWASAAIQANAPFIRYHQKDVAKEWFTGVHGSSFWLRENCLDVANTSSGCFSRISVNPGNVMGINNFNPGSAVDVTGEIRVRGASISSAFVNAGELALKNDNSDPRLSFHANNGTEIAGVWSRNNLDLRIANFQNRPMRFFTNSLERVTILGNGDVGIGTNNPNSRLTISRTGAALAGSVVSSTLNTNSGALGGNANDRMKLATLGFTTGNSVSLGVEARRQTTGADWTTTSIGLKFEVDNTTWDNKAIWLTAPGNVGVGTPDPTAKLDIDGQIRIRGGAPGAGKVLTSDANGTATWETP
ncbi:MAG: hypothetical protein JJT77_07290, partial [Crocinitomicaceae bacterium]|nr:hypothetical protein [Crocinitomicaceae bacterium]